MKWSKNMTASLKHPCKTWTVDEIEYLERVIENPEGVKTDEIADFLGRTTRSVTCKMCEIRKKKFPEEKGHPFNGWEQSEIDFLKKAARTIPYAEIARKLNKTVTAVSDKASRLGIKKNPVRIRYSEIKKIATGEYTVKEMASHFGTSQATVRSYLHLHPELKYKRVQKETIQKIKEREYRRWQYYKKSSLESRR